MNYSSIEIRRVHNYVQKKLGNEYDLDMLGTVLKQSEFPWALIFVYLFQYETYCDACQIVMDFFMAAFE